jgi:hypothetical protein
MSFSQLYMTKRKETSAPLEQAQDKRKSAHVILVHFFAGAGEKCLKMPSGAFWRGFGLDERPIFERKRRGRRCANTNCPGSGPTPAS